ncbi:MAG: ATP-binding protein [bacterium]
MSLPTKFSQRTAYAQRPALSRHLPYLEILDDFIIKKNGNFVAGFDVQPLDNMSLAAGDYARMAATLENVLNAVDANVNLQFSSYFDYFPYSGDFVYTDDPELDFFKLQRHKYYSFFKYLTCQSYLFVDFDAGQILRTPFNILMSTGEVKTRLQAEHEKLVLEKNHILKTLQTSLENTGVKLRRLRTSDLAHVLYQALNLTTDEFPGTLRGKATNNELVRQDYEVEKGFLKIGAQFLACLSLSLLPEMTRDHMDFSGIPLPYIFPLLHNLPFPHRVVFSTQNLDMEKETARLSRQLNFSRFIMNFSRQREGRKSEVKFRELNELLDEIYSQHKKLATISLNLLVYDADRERLNQKINQAQLAFAGIDKAQCVLETLDVLPIFISTLPGNGCENYHRLVAKNSNAACFINLTNFNRGHHRGMVMKNRNGEPVLFDYFDQNLNSWNSIIVGPTGTGKSYLMQSMLLQFLEQGVKVFGLDVGGVGELGGSYKKMIKLLKGRYIELNIDRPIPLNPFALVKPSESSELDTKKTLFLRAFIEKLLLEREQKSISKVEQGFISKTLQHYLEHYRGPRNLQTFVDFFAKQTDPDGYVDVKLMARKMYMYTHGEYSRFLCADEMIDIREDLVCFDLKGLETHPDLQGIIAIVITGLLWDLMERNLAFNKVIFADELWKVLDDNSTIGHLVVELFRTSRKMGAGIFAISQSIEDIDKVSYSTPIKDNALNHFILGHKPKQLEGLVRAFGYTERELAIISSLQRGEFFLDRDGKMTVLRADMSTYDHYLFTTDRQENNLLEEKLSKHSGDLIKAIKEIAVEKDYELSPYLL